MAINFDDLLKKPMFEEGDTVQTSDGRRGCVERVVRIQNEADRRARPARPGKMFYEVSLDGGVERFRAMDLKKIDILDVLADAG